MSLAFASPPSRPQRLAVAAVTLGAGLWLVRGGLCQNLSLDECWHMFFSWGGPFGRAAHEVLEDTHPPLPYVLVAPLLELGGDPLWPRLVSIVPAIVQVPVLFSILHRLSIMAPIALAVTTAFAASHAFTEMGVVVRAYSLTTLLTLLSLRMLLELLPGGRPSRRAATVGLAAAAVAACCLYSSLFATAAVGGGMIFAGVLRPDFGRPVLAGLRSHSRWPEWLVLVAGVVATLIWMSLTYGAKGPLHVQHIFPRPGQDALSYLVRGTVRDLRFFTPLEMHHPAAGLAAAGGAGVALLGLLWWSWRTRAMVRFAILAALALLWAQLWVLGLMRLYPFGGELRHQYVLYPFMMMALAIGLDLVARLLPRRLRPALAVLVVAIAGLTTVRSQLGDEIGEFPGRPYWTEQAGRMLGPGADRLPVLMPRYAFYPFWGVQRHRRWSWVEKANDGFDRFAVGGPDGAMVLRDRYTWTLPPVPADGYWDRLDEALRGRAIEALWVFSPRLERPAPIAERVALEPELRAAAARHGFVLGERQVFEDGEMYVLRR